MKHFISTFLVMIIISLVSPYYQAQEVMWMRIDSTTMINGHLCYAGNYGSGNDLFGTNYLLEENGYVRTYAEWHYQLGFFLYDSISSYFVKQSPQLGDIWYGGGFQYPIKFTVLEMEMITVPAGTFLTYKVEGRTTSTNNLEQVNYFADSVGVVRSIDYEDDFEMELASYNTQGGGCFPLNVGNEWLFNILPVSVYRYSNDNPINFILWNAYPNPFNPTTKIKYTIPEMSFLTLKVYDVLGNEVAILVNEEKPAGSYEVEFDGKNLTSGIYFYKLQAGNFVETRKMILLK